MINRLKYHIKEVASIIHWYVSYRSLGIPVEFRKNSDYIDWHINQRASLRKYYNIHSGEDCFIVGNGPSLNKMNLEKLNDYHVFGMNKIHLIFEKQDLKLSYHVTVNELVIEQIEKELNENVYGCPSFISYYASKEKKYKNPLIHKIFSRGPIWSFYSSLMGPISEGYTVTYVAMQIAYFMGFRNVYLVGVDHNFQQKGKANEEQKFKGNDVNHFHPDYFKNMQWHLADLEGNEASYALAKHQYHANGREIYDATIDGKLNIYQKISFEEALKNCKKKS